MKSKSKMLKKRKQIAKAKTKSKSKSKKQIVNSKSKRHQLEQELLLKASPPCVKTYGGHSEKGEAADYPPVLSTSPPSSLLPLSIEQFER